MTRRTINRDDFVTFEPYLFPQNPQERGLETLAAALTISGHENKWLRLSAETQKALLGRNFFGRKRVGLFDGQFRASWKVCFGMDSETVHVSPFRFAHDPDYRLN